MAGPTNRAMRRRRAKSEARLAASVSRLIHENRKTSELDELIYTELQEDRKMIELSAKAEMDAAVTGSVQTIDGRRIASVGVE